ncbi:MAG: LEA type 2 family protein [Phycisphaerales bacterium]
MKVRPALALSLSTALLAGCSSVAPPELRVTEAKVSQSTDGSLLTILLDAENPNDEPLPLREVRYSVEVNGTRVFEGLRSAESTLRRYGTRTIALPVSLPPGSPGNISGGAFRIRGELTYKEPGALAQTLLDAELVNPSVSFAGEGTFGGSPEQPPQQPPQ